MNKIEVRHRNMTLIRNAKRGASCHCFPLCEIFVLQWLVLVIAGRTRSTVRTRIITQVVRGDEMVCSRLV